MFHCRNHYNLSPMNLFLISKVCGPLKIIKRYTTEHHGTPPKPSETALA